ncbi:ADP-ribosylglycohydrolase family protein [Nonomuraea sp. KC401]|uniref:ADP-ribosylglycohydrolase family protein n=1 Tax=unclassified Nonomuraea TaxID=2593643 RepID=UPI0010FF5114|nr:ADP-ribosylglycohydrolase family protein [Nonomuraea sp. KC401]NBE96803.1 ADP-ribosylglycohydrolase family protein [Nonomuraea sp. K271]TLF68004.1 ADP-ribosylglycohydrolase family protein [Nonomuraea sp. KC401]
MHDVLDPRDLVPDEAEQLALSGYQVGGLRAAAREAAAEGDLAGLAEVRTRLAELERDPGWDFEEPENDRVLLEHAATVSPVEAERELLPERIHGAWLGRAVGNTLGKPVEGLTRAEIAAYLRAAGQSPQTGYLPLLDPLPEGVGALHPSAQVATAGRFVDVPRDDDIDWTILALHVLETHGAGFTTEQIAATWLDRVPFTQTYTAERAAYRNLIGGLRPPATATTDNPYREWIGALIRGDAFGYVSPGDPAGAARLALVDARLSHTANGKYGEMWAAALVAAALAADSVQQALRHALSVVPPRSRLHFALAHVLSLREQGAGRVKALDWVDEALGDYPWVHTVNNAALITIGLLWGGHFMDAVGLTISGGRDTDSNAATVGSVYGALHGRDGIPPELVGTTHVHVRSAVRDFDRITVAELAARTARLAGTFAPP